MAHARRKNSLPVPIHQNEALVLPGAAGLVSPAATMTRFMVFPQPVHAIYPSHAEMRFAALRFEGPRKIFITLS
jgi:hypothetical protein